MNIAPVTEIFPFVDKKRCPDLVGPLENLSSIENLFYGFIYGFSHDNRFIYLSPSIKDVTGFETNRFLCQDGMAFFYNITPEHFLPHINERVARYIKETREAHFDIRKPQLLEINAGLRHRGGAEMKIRLLAVVLEYSLYNDILLTLGTWHRVDGLTNVELAEMKATIQRQLRNFKEIYVRLSPEKFPRQAPGVDEPVRIIYPVFERPNVSKREVKILKLLADGLSSKQIAYQLQISFHTAEAHRKNLLMKFGAKNAAELMKKASKMFWFE